MPTYEFFCDKCDLMQAAEYMHADRPSTIPCEVCGNEAVYKISMGNVMRVALPDGTKRAGFAEMREASKLKTAMLKEKPGTDARRELNREVKKVQGKLGE